MPLGLTIALIATPFLIFGVRAALPGIPWKRYARTASWLELVLIAIGALGLILHCIAMFARGLLEAIPGAGGYIHAVNGMSAASIALYVIPAVIVLAGLRRQQPLAVTLVAITLVAVGVTMYDGGPLDVHLIAITAAALAIAVTTALLVLPLKRIASDRRDG